MTSLFLANLEQHNALLATLHALDTQVLQAGAWRLNHFNKVASFSSAAMVALRQTANIWLPN